MQSKTFAKKTIAVSIWVAAFVTISIGSVYATWQTYSSSMSTGVGQTGTYCSTDGTLFAENGDVVTTDKWNNLSCHVRNMWYMLTDGMRGKTSFIRGHNDTTTSPAGFIVDEINLPIKSGISGANYGGAIHFKDSDTGYVTPGGWMGGIIYGLSAPNTRSLDFAGFTNGVRITESVSGGNKPYLIGWEKISLTDDAPFDTQCQYRVRTSNGNTIYMNTSSNVLSAMEDSNWSNTAADPLHMEVYASAQVSLWGKTALKQMYPDGNTGNPHGNVASIEKFCLPSYNPNNLP